MVTLGLYIIHNPELNEREKAYMSVVNALQLTPNMVWYKSVNNLTDEDNKRFADNVLPTQRSLILNHEYALKDSLQNEYDYTIVLEDYAFCTNPELLNKIVNNIKAGMLPYFQSCYLGCGCLPDLYKNINVENNKYYMIQVARSRCTEAMLYSKDGIKTKLLLLNKVINKPLNHYFDEFYLSEPNYKNFHFHPHPIIQYGFKSTIC